MATLEEWKLLTIEDIYYPKIDKYLRIFTDITTFLSLIIYSFLAFIILTKSPKQMGAFKYTVFTQITFNMLYKVLGFLFHPTFFFPLPALTLTTAFTAWPQPSFIFVATLIIFTIVATVTAIFCTVVNRVLAAFQTKNSLIHSSKNKYIVGILMYFGITVIVLVAVMTPLKMAEINFDEYYTTLENAVPVFNELEQHFSSPIYVLSLKPINDYLIGLVIIALIITFSYAIAFIALNMIVIQQLRKIKKLVSKSTYGIHKMLHTAVMIQTVNLLLFAVLPITMIAGGLICQQPYGSLIANFGFPLSSLHLIVDAPALLHFIKPYRSYVMGLMPFKKKRIQASNIPAPSEWFRGLTTVS